MVTVGRGLVKAFKLQHGVLIVYVWFTFSGFSWLLRDVISELSILYNITHDTIEQRINTRERERGEKDSK